MKIEDFIEKIGILPLSPQNSRNYYKKVSDTEYSIQINQNRFEHYLNVSMSEMENNVVNRMDDDHVFLFLDNVAWAYSIPFKGGEQDDGSIFAIVYLWLSDPSNARTRLKEIGASSAEIDAIETAFILAESGVSIYDAEQLLSSMKVEQITTTVGIYGDLALAKTIDRMLMGKRTTKLFESEDSLEQLKKKGLITEAQKQGILKGTGKSYSPANPHPTLSAEVQNSFSGGTFTETVLTQDTTFYRVYGGNAGEVGRYMSRVPQNGGLQSQIDLALNPGWGNTAQNVTKVIVPKGTAIFEGTAAPQSIYGGAGNLLGGGNQVYIPEVNASWFGK